MRRAKCKYRRYTRRWTDRKERERTRRSRSTGTWPREERRPTHVMKKVTDNIASTRATEYNEKNICAEQNEKIDDIPAIGQIVKECE